MKLSTDNFNFKTSLDPTQFQERLNKRTHKSSSLVMVSTSKDFIGTISNSGFKLISSWFPIGAACVVNGRLNTDEDNLELTTTLHQAFQILFVIWLIVMAGLLVFGLSATTEPTKWLTAVIGLLACAIFFRLFIHGVYVLARNKFIRQLSELLNLKE